MKRPVILLGFGGHARVLLEILRMQNVEIVAVVDPSCEGTMCHSENDYKFLSSDDEVFHYSPSQVYLVNGIGSVDVGNHRQQLFQYFKRHGYTFISVIHPSAILSSDLQLGEGVQIMAGAVLQPGSKFGDNVLVNTGAVIDHDCTIGDHVHVAPGSVVSGNVTIGEGTHIGTGAKIINNISIGANCTVGAGAVVIDNVPPDTRLAGVPAKSIGKNRPKE